MMMTPADTPVAGAVTANAVASSWASSRDLLIRGERRVWTRMAAVLHSRLGRPYQVSRDWAGPARFPECSSAANRQLCAVAKSS
jgi:hypothetical protein